jgi:hypothetical protein
MNTPKEIATRFSVKPEAVTAWIAAGELVAINVARPGATRPRWRISEEAIEDFERRRSSRPQQNPKPASRRRRPIKKYV